MVELLKSFSGKAGKPPLQAAARSRQSCLKPVFMGIPWFVSDHFDGVVAGAEGAAPAGVITTTARTAIDYAHRLNATMRDQTPLGSGVLTRISETVGMIEVSASQNRLRKIIRRSRLLAEPHQKTDWHHPVRPLG